MSGEANWQRVAREHAQLAQGTGGTCHCPTCNASRENAALVERLTLAESTAASWEHLLSCEREHRGELRAINAAMRLALEAAMGFIGKARELLGEWQSDGWSKPVSRATSEFFGSTDIAYGCEYVDCKQPFGHKHVSGGPAEQKAALTPQDSLK